MAYTREQRRNIRRSLRVANRLGATRKIKKALLEAEGVESGFRNLSYGDRDSRGILQQRPSQGWGVPAGVKTDVAQFVQAAKQINHKGLSASALAQAIQRSAFPGRYKEHAGEANRLLANYGSQHPMSYKGGSPGQQGTRLLSGFDPGTGSQAVVAALTARLTNSRPQVPVSSGVPSPSFSALRSLPSVPSTPVSSGAIPDAKVSTLQDTLDAIRTVGQGLPGVPPSGRVKGQATTGAAPGGKFKPRAYKGTATFDGKTVAAWIKPALVYARQHGWKGTVSSGYRSYAQQKAIYDSGVRPAAVPGTSNHEGDVFPRGAVDVTDAAQLAKVLRGTPYGRVLKWAGSKDPPHFSHPHNGGY